MSHFICKGGCNGVADTPGTCQASDCADFEKDLIECSCEDGNHGSATEEGSGE
ncbi:hypothetical protein HOK40_03135 [Candidatus Peregrinibacteria bacterium]|nr:hypothetical protein [Candidatus Peregrinibacteria bacterium]MBT7337518.1 hypothetical protein [Candidatus Peregrinibacteria bacterium]